MAIATPTRARLRHLQVSFMGDHRRSQQRPLHLLHPVVAARLGVAPVQQSATGARRSVRIDLN